jgi:hypothetical protein
VDPCLSTESPDKARPTCTFQLFTLQQKSIHAAGNHHWSRQNIWLIRTPVTFLKFLKKAQKWSYCSKTILVIKI